MKLSPVEEQNLIQLSNLTEGKGQEQRGKVEWTGNMGTRRGPKNEGVEYITKEESWQMERGEVLDWPGLGHFGGVVGGRRGKEVTEIKGRVSLACRKVEKQNTESNHWGLFRLDEIEATKRDTERRIGED